ncbi:MAG: glycosyltransferase [Morganella sp. (in: enterobacteria)]
MHLSVAPSQPLLSIVAAVYNGEKFLPQFFECLKKQSLPAWELILVDDGSKDNTAAVLDEWKDKFPSVTIIRQENQGVSVARNTGFAAAKGIYVTFPDIDDVIHPPMYGRLLDIALQGQLDVATCNGTYVYEDGQEPNAIFPSGSLRSTGVISGPQWLKRALDSRKFLHVTWLNLYRSAFLRGHNYRFEPGLHHQDIPWTTELLLTAERVEYIDERYYDYLIHSESVSHTPQDDKIRVRTIHNYMKILEMLNAINHRYADVVKQVPACHWQISKEGLGILHTINDIESQVIQQAMIQELFDRGIWTLIWDNANDLRLRWRLARRYPRLKSILKVSADPVV